MTAPTVVSRSELDTVALGERVGRALVSGDLITLTGPLGAGKTVLVRGLALGAGAAGAAVRSPTFVLHHVYRGARITLHHIDLYRLGAGADLSLLDLQTLLETGAVAVEWGELADLQHFNAVRVRIDVEDAARVLTLMAPAPARITAAWRVEDSGA